MLLRTGEEDKTNTSTTLVFQAKEVVIRKIPITSRKTLDLGSKNETAKPVTPESRYDDLLDAIGMRTMYEREAKDDYARRHPKRYRNVRLRRERRKVASRLCEMT